MGVSVSTRPASPEDWPRRSLAQRADDLVWLLSPAFALAALGGALGTALARREEPVEVLHVREARCIASARDPAPAFLFDLDGARSLLVTGEALADARTFRGADGPDAFPCAEFALHRGAVSGRLVRVDVLGAPLRPLATVPSIAPLLRGRVRLRDVKEALVLDVPFAAWTAGRELTAR